MDYQFEASTPDDIKHKAQIARKAQAQWFEGGLARRIEILQRWAVSLQQHSDAIVDALTIDTGRNRISREEVGALVSFIQGYCKVAPEVLAEPLRKFTNNADVVFQTTLVPFSLVGVISPWNFPLMLSFIDGMPALLAGAALIVKPSEITPRFVEPLQRSIDAVPELAGIVTLVRGGPDAGEAIIANSDAIVFTGSIKTGRKIAVAAAQAFIPAFLELGGKDAAVVLAGSDVDRAATAILRSAIYNSGQVCYAIERVYVAASAHDALVESLVRQAATLRRSAAAGDGGHYGPFIFEPQAGLVEAKLKDAVSKGAKILCGGRVEKADGALWMDPTIVTGVNHGMALMTEETFGPVVPVMKFETAREAEELVNGTNYGLSGAVFGPDATTAGAFGARMLAGGVSINDTELPRGMLFDGEKTAFKMSGMGGSRYGPASMLRYVRKRALITNHGDVKPLDALSEVVPG